MAGVPVNAEDAMPAFQFDETKTIDENLNLSFDHMTSRDA
jgi:hypothetical protein